MGSHLLVCAEVVETLSNFPASFYDACLCDPPYFLEFMGKDFDRQHKLRPGANDGQRMQAWHTEWAQEVYRVLKPGAFVMAFGGTRTYHRLAAAFEDVGFEMRDCLMWVYGSGFPKSLNIGKAVASWSGYGTSLKPAWEPIILAMKPCEGTFAANALRHGVAGLNIEKSRIKYKSADDLEATQRGVNAMRSSSERTKPRGNKQEGWSRPWMDKEGAMAASIPDPSPEGRWPANLLLSHHDSCLEPECHPLCPVRMLDGQSLERGMHSAGRARDGSSAKVADSYSASSYQLPPNRNMRRLGDSGGATRFFYTAKVSTRERNLGLPPGVTCSHPTLKPFSLCRYLATLLLPPARTDTPRALLVPFSGAGSEVTGGLLSGWDTVLGIEQDPESVEWAEMRIAAACREKAETAE